jgi:ubiquinone/menaquinone biosynthesis C-methylase UbiE
VGSVKELSLIEKSRTAARRAAFEALYGPLAWAYDWVSRTFFLGQWRQWQRAALPHLTGHRILEVGMGTGNLQIDLTRAGYEAWGIDLSPQMLRQARRKLLKIGIQPLLICRAGAQSLPFSGGSFDSVVSTFPSDYIAMPDTLKEIRRVLRPGGRLVIVPAGWLNPKSPEGHLFDGIAKLVYGKGNSQVSNEADFLQRLEGSTWVGTLRGRMSEARFTLSSLLASNQRGTALVLIGQLA